MASENKATDPSPSQNVVNRVTSIPLIHSAFNLVSSAYNFTKGTHPYVTTVCTVAETVAAVAVGSAVGGAQPILSHLEPQIAKVNEYACKSLDQLEEKLPFLQQLVCISHPIGFLSIRSCRKSSQHLSYLPWSR
uniref:Perilipin 3 n=1 Tax=Crocodylus porosus TaxID=8502 RepID=A0A7M4EP16_CROPO